MGFLVPAYLLIQQNRLSVFDFKGCFYHSGFKIVLILQTAWTPGVILHAS